MGRRGRPPKVKAVPRVLSESSRESSSSPERYIFQESASQEKPVAIDSAMSIPSGRVGLSWVSILKSPAMKSGIPPPPLPTPSVSSSIHVSNAVLPQNNSSTPTVRKIAKISKGHALDKQPEILPSHTAGSLVPPSANPNAAQQFQDSGQQVDGCAQQIEGSGQQLG
ncbi:unnamed protein product [Amaranthus hypochondriacus]